MVTEGLLFAESILVTAAAAAGVAAAESSGLGRDS